MGCNDCHILLSESQIECIVDLSTVLSVVQLLPCPFLVILRLYQVANLCTSYAFNIICSILIDFLHNILWLLDFRIITILTQKLLIKSIKTTKDQAIFSYMDIWSSVHIGIEEYTRKRMKQNLTCLFIFRIIFIRRCWNFFNIWCGKLWEKKSLTEGVHQKEKMIFKVHIKLHTPVWLLLLWVNVKFCLCFDCQW